MTVVAERTAKDHLLLFLREAGKCGASDLHLTAEAAPAVRIEGGLRYMDTPALTGADIQAMFLAMTSEAQQKKFTEDTEIDLAYQAEGMRFRINAFKQRGQTALAIRIIYSSIRSLEELGHPAVLRQMSFCKHGLLLITGTTGSGKSTTLAAIVDLLNRTQAYHIITLEDPIEYVHLHRKSIVNQREAGTDFRSFSGALRAALREDPDVIMVGELRDRETVQTALIAAETGHFVLGTLHTFDATEAVLRIESLFPAHQQEQIRLQLSQVLQGIAAQQLLPGKDGGGRVCAMEILRAVPAIRNLIREGKSPQISSQLQMGGALGMRTMDMAIQDLLQAGKISRETARVYAKNEKF